MKTHIGHYEVVAILGRGGMGVVYKGYEPALARFVAIKELTPALAHDPSLVERFLREARSMAALNDPHILQIHFIGEDAGQPFFAMEFVDGESLSSAIKRERRLHPGDALKILLQAAQGLAVAHDHGVIHRDIKPANLLLTQRGQVKIADFGIALANQEFDSKLTGTGQLVGTPGYLSPEVCLGKPVDARSDIFALGIVLFEMLTGHTPFSDESPFKLMLEVVQLEIPDVRELNDEVDADVAAMLSKMLAKDPAARYQTVHELIADLGKLASLPSGTGLSFKTLPAVGSAATQMLPATPGGVRPPTPLPGAVATPHVSTRPPIPTPAPAAPVPVAAKSRWPIWAGLALLLVIGAAFAWRTWLMPAPAAPAVAAIASPAPTTPAVVPAPVATVAAAAPATVAVATELMPDAAPPPAPVAPAPLAATPPTVKPKPKPAASEEAPAPEEEPTQDEPVFVQVPTLTPGLRTQRAENRIERRIGQRAIAVVSQGDQSVSGPAKQVVEQQLRDAGVIVVESPAQADVIVRINADVAAGGPSFGGGPALSAGTLSIQAFGAGGRPLGPITREHIQFSPDDIDEQVGRLINKSSGRLVDLLNRQP